MRFDRLRRRMPGRHWSGKLMLCLALTAVLTSACVTGLGQSVYQVRIPTLQAQPRVFECGDRVCIALIKEDYEAIVLELKAACIASGQSDEACQLFR